VPAAAVIPAPVAYIKTAAVKTLVVGNLLEIIGLPQWSVLGMTSTSSWLSVYTSLCVQVRQNFYFEEMRVFKAGFVMDTLAWNNSVGPCVVSVG
jgi:hypothetical protein